MIKKSLRYIVLMMLLVFSEQSFGMHTAVLRFSKLAGASLAAYPAWNAAHSLHKMKSVYRVPMPDNIQSWTRNILTECNINDNIPLAISNWGETKGWAVIGGKQVIIGEKQAEELAYNLQMLENANATPEQLQMAHRVVACNEQIVRHEAGHIYHQHYKKKWYRTSWGLVLFKWQHREFQPHRKISFIYNLPKQSLE